MAVAAEKTMKLAALVFVAVLPSSFGQVNNINLDCCKMQLSCGKDVCQASDDVFITKCPQTIFEFPATGQTTDWIRLKEPVPRIEECTICFWVSPRSLVKTPAKSILSYATRKSDNALLVEMATTGLTLLLNGARGTVPLEITEKIHVCIAASPINGDAIVYLNGEARPRLSYSTKGSIEGGGSLLIGQEQDAFMDKFHPDQAFAGTLENLMIWYRLLSATEISLLRRNRCSCPQGYAVAFTADQIQLAGKVATLPVEQC